MHKILARILHVDDEQESLKIVSKALLAGGDYIIESCTSCEGALILCQFFHPDLFILDVDMPDIDGMETLTRLRALPQCKDTAAIFLTGHATRADYALYEKLDVIGVIAKPFDPRALHQKVLDLYMGIYGGKEQDALIDTEQLKEFRDIVEDEFSSLVRTYQEDGASHIQDILTSLHNNNPVTAKARAHSLKSSSGYIGAITVRNLAEQLEHTIDENSNEDSILLARKLEAAFDQTKILLHPYCF